jgi:hypothetical protein
VLILEDDAQFMPGATDADFALVDEFVATHEFDVYSLGSIGPFRPVGWRSRHRTFVNHWGITQAIIWSPSAREELLRRAAHRLPMHIDLGFLAQLPRCFTLDRPLVVQTFPVTANSANWCFMCTGGLVGRVDRGVARLYHAGLGRLGLDRSVHGWRTLYVCNSAVLPVLIVMCLAVIAALLSALRRRLACTFQCGPPAISTVTVKSADCKMSSCPARPWPRPSAAHCELPPSAAVRRRPTPEL